jgi:hypothetical protein
MSAKARQQSAILANPACHDLLVEKMPSLVSSVYDHHERAAGSSLVPMFHMLCNKIKIQPMAWLPESYEKSAVTRSGVMF